MTRRLLNNRSESAFLHNRQKAQGWATRLLNAALPVGNKVLGDIQITCKYWLGHTLAQANGFVLICTET